MPGIPPLPPGTVLAGRFEIYSTLGRGGFSVAYLARDLSQDDECVVKELAPTGAIRNDTQVDLSTIHTTNPLRLKKRFLDEANLIGKLNAPGVLHLRDAFEENGTAYFVTDMMPGARTLQSILSQEGRMDADAVQDILLQILDIMEIVHRRKVLHRDIKPSNILLSPKGEVYLIDFGAAREWHADSAALQTVLFTPGYAPLEQLSDRGRRGPATDIYSICATVYEMLTGFPPRPSAERADGTDMIPLNRLRPDLDQPLSQAITAGLQLHFRNRPQSIAELRSLLLTPDPEEPSLSTVEAFDAAAVRLKRFNFSRNQCPVCSGVLERPKPLKIGVCPVCREGHLEDRHTSSRLCPSCKTGILQPQGGKSPLLFCPQCKNGLMEFHRKGLLLNRWQAECKRCGAQMEGDPQVGTLSYQEESTQHPWAEWKELSGRSSLAWQCDVCDNIYEVLPNGRWKDLSGHEKHSYFPDEWALIAAGLEPGAGNVFCDSCGADFYRAENNLTLLSYHHDSHKFGAHYVDQELPLSDVPWLAVGKTSGNKGLTCPQCDTEFDDDGEHLRLIRTPSVRLSRLMERSLVMEDWHRLSQGLPLMGEEDQFETRLCEALTLGFERREIFFDDRNQNLFWSGQASELKLEGEEWVGVAEGNLTVTSDEISFGKVLRRWRAPFSSILTLIAEENILQVGTSGESEVRIFELEPVELRIHLESGERVITLNAESLAKAIHCGLPTAAQT